MIATEPSRPDQRSVGAVLSGLNHLGLWRGKTVVINYGGAAMGRAELRACFARDVARLRATGVHPVVVHGGRPQIRAMVSRINPELVGLINQHGGHAIGLKGKGSDLIGVESINPEPLRLLEGHGLIPVIAPIATGRDGATYNVNADHVAGMVAAARGAAMLLQLTDVPGILDRDGRPLDIVSRQALERLVRERVVSGGMLAKVDAALHALDGGAARVRIIDGRRPHAVGLALLGNEGLGTEIVL